MKITEQLNGEALLMEMGKRISHLRVVRGLRQEALARRCGISRFALSRLANGAGGARLESFFSVLRQLDVLPRMELVLEEISLTPLQEAALESADRLAYAGKRGMGALEYRPAMLDDEDKTERIEVDSLMVFNGLAWNCDAHEKNIAYLMDRNGRWTLAA